MSVIYEPKGKAREYSPLAYNPYVNCDHKCEYCYVKQLYSAHQHDPVKAREGIIENLTKESPRFKNKAQILISFMGDPYCSANDQLQITRKSLEIMQRNGNIVAILTKGGKRVLQDLELIKSFGKKIKIGATLTFVDEARSLKVEPGAATPKDRFEALSILHGNGIRTWVSLEPVLDHKETLRVIEETHSYVDEYKLGLTNYYKLEKPIDWPAMAKDAIKLFRKYNSKFYIKKDLRDLIPNVEKLLTPEEMDQDYLTIKPAPEMKQGGLF